VICRGWASHHGPSAALARIALVVGACLLSVTALSGRGAAGWCRIDRDCDGYYRCLAGMCGVLPAVHGRSDTHTPTVELGAGEVFRGRFFVELARTPWAHRRESGQRPFLAEGWGMLFVFPTQVRYSFTMAPMRFALDVILIDERGEIVEVIEKAQPGVPNLAVSNPYNMS